MCTLKILKNCNHQIHTGLHNIYNSALVKEIIRLGYILPLHGLRRSCRKTVSSIRRDLINDNFKYPI